MDPSTFNFRISEIKKCVLNKIYYVAHCWGKYESKEASRQTTLPCFALTGRPVQQNSNAGSKLKQTDRTDCTENRTGETEGVQRVYRTTALK